MEDKLKREAKTYLEKLFKKCDNKSAGAITMPDMIKIVKTTVDDFNPELEMEELTELMHKHAKDTKYTEHNKKTNQFEMKFQKDTLDFPSALAIVVHFLKKREKCSNAFSGKSMVRNHDLPDSHRHLLTDNDLSQKRRLY